MTAAWISTASGRATEMDLEIFLDHSGSVSPIDFTVHLLSTLRLVAQCMKKIQFDRILL